MVKNIVIKETEKDINILVNGVSKITISKGKHEINAKDIYDILDYQPGDKYTIELLDANDSKKFLEKFKELLEMIVEKLSQVDCNGKPDTIETKLKDEKIIE